MDSLEDRWSLGVGEEEGSLRERERVKEDIVFREERKEKIEKERKRGTLSAPQADSPPFQRTSNRLVQ